MKQQVILFKTHYIDKNILQEFKNLKTACNTLGYDIFLAYDNSRNDFKLENINSFLFTLDDLQTSGYELFPIGKLPKGKNHMWFHADFPVLAFYNKYNQYDYYWQIEFDVRFNGDWVFFFKHFTKDDSDFNSIFISSKINDPKWKMWDKHNFDFSDNEIKSGVFPIVRFSNFALNIIDNECKNGKTGYCEVIFPTVLNNLGYKISSFDSFFNKYTFQFYHSIPEWAYNTLRKMPFTKNKLFHPVRKNTIHGLIYSLLYIERRVGQVGVFLKSKFPSIYNFLKPYFPDKT